MKQILLLISIYIFSSPCFSNASLSNNNNVGFLPEKSKWEVGLGFNLGFSSNRGLILELNPSLQYFVVDNLSIGGFIHYYKEDDFSFISAGPSATLFIYQEGPLAIVLNQRVRFREYIEPEDLDAAQVVSLTSLAADWKVGGGLSRRGPAIRLGIGYRLSLDDKALLNNGDKTEEWIFPTLGFAYYL